ncbi:hypothetical protein KIN20_032125 [Parelaphostrongylus tenuis]|uniref:C2H2-type domain-containing protein n=1 Tax=Parelaphostrongylus tenuis TaxID=148309 RepID=A0AAD5R6J5_PARTN|nr:hypothetical protein KIN20_032125 [Parelaphostrongylus tenuis]
MGCGSVTRKRSKRGVQSETEKACTPSGTITVDVSHKQVSDSESNAKVAPLTAIEEVSNECPSQSTELLLCDNPSPEDLEVTSMGCSSVTKKSSRRGVRSGAKTAYTPSRTIAADVSHKQLSDSESNAKVAPLTAIEEVSNECSSQSTELILCDIQSPIDSQVTSMGCGSVTRKRSKRGVQSETGRERAPSGTITVDVLPSKRSIRVHKQVSIVESTAEVAPSITIEEMSNECSSQRMELSLTPEEPSHQKNLRSRKRRIESENLPTAPKRRKSDLAVTSKEDISRNMRVDKSKWSVEGPSAIRNRSGTAALNSLSVASQHVSNLRCEESVGEKSSASNNLNDDIVLISDRSRSRSPTPPLSCTKFVVFRVAVNMTASFTAVKRDNDRCADPLVLTTCNRGEAIQATVCSSDSAEILNSLALGIIIKEASVLSTVNLATFAQLVFNLLGLETSCDIFGKLVDGGVSTLPASFTTIFERTTPLQFRHRLDYSSFSELLMSRLPENGLHALTLDFRKVSMLKITSFVDTIAEAVDEVCDELTTLDGLSKRDIETEKDLSAEVRQLIASRYVETMTKLADACNLAPNVPIEVIAGRFHLLLYGWDSFLQQGGVLRVRLQLCTGTLSKSEEGIVAITTSWLDKIDTVLSRAYATLSTRTSAFAVSLAQEKNVMNKIWHKMAMQTTSSRDDKSYSYCSECKLYFHNEDTDFMHNRVFHHKSRECEECYDMFHTLLGLDLHMVGRHKRTFLRDL